MWPYVPALIVVVGALFAAGGSFWQAIRQSHFNAEIRLKNETIIRLQNENISQLTGADSFCHVDVTFTARDAITFILHHTGTYAVPDVTVQLQDSAEFVKLFEEAKAGNTALLDDAFTITKLATKIVPIGTVIPNSQKLLLTVPYTGERRNFFISIVARNGFYREQITVMRLSDGADVVDGHLFKTEGDKEVEIWQQISDAFPRSKSP